MKRKLFVTLALAALILALACGAALAVIEGGPLNEDGSVWYENDYSGTIRIGGEGATKDYGSSYNLSPLDGKAMTAVEIEAGVTRLGNNLFYGCADLTTATIMNPDAVISGTAFRLCSSLTTICGWECSTAAAYAAANGYEFSSLGSLTGSCGANVTYSFDPVTGTLTISGAGAMANYTGPSDCPWYNFKSSILSVTILNGVTRIGSYVFSYCSDMTDVIIPDGVTTIGIWAFANCSSLTSVTIPDGVTSIADAAFAYCTSMTDVTMSKSVSGILGYAFYSCTSLTNATILHPDAYITNNAFAGCSPALTIHGWSDSTAQTYAQNNGITFDAFETSGSCGDNLTWAFDLDTGKMTISGTGAMDDYDSDDDAPWYAFKDCITTLAVEDGVTSVSRMAFCYSANLTSATMAGSVADIGYFAFQNCPSLASVTVMNPACVIGDSDHDVFQGCNTPVLKGWSGSTAETYAGYLDSNVTFESLGALSGSCGENVTYSFNPATGAMTISGTGRMTDYRSDTIVPWYRYRDSIKSITIESHVASIGNRAFMYSAGLTNISIPDSVTSIGYWVFFGCHSLTNVTIPNSVISIGEYAFRNSGLISVTLPSNMTFIAPYVFSGCKNLANVTIPDSVTGIGIEAFDNCTSLTGATVWNPDCVIGDSNYSVFRGCPSDFTLHGWAGSTAEAYAANTVNPCNFELMAPAPDLFLPAGLKSIEADAFSGVSAEAVVIPKSIQTITGNPFAGSEVLYIYGFPGTAAQTLAESDPIRFMFFPLTDAWYARLTSK